MNIQSLRAFFGWCTIINIGLLAISVETIVIAADFIYNISGQMCSLQRESFDMALYCFMGLYMIAILAFNLAPWVALRIMDKKGKRDGNGKRTAQ